MAVRLSDAATEVALPWRDPSQSAGDRAEALLAALTLEEKVAQLGSCWVGNRSAPASDAEAAESSEATESSESANVSPMEQEFGELTARSLEEVSQHGLGQLTRVWGSRPLTLAEGSAETVRQHHAVLANSRLGIPALVHEECLTGFTAYGATVYPTALAWGAAFDPELVERMAAAIGTDMAALGVHQGLSPVLDVVRDYRWGRVEETIGEDPHLVATLGTAYVRGLQSAGVVATLKHFAGYSASRAARNHAPVSMGRRELLEVMLPAFEAAIAVGGARSVMNSYTDVDGVPAAADPWLFTELLRDEWGFTGTVVSDYWAVPFLAWMHRVADDLPGAGALALAAGIDVELPDAVGFGAGLVDKVRRGELGESLVDRAVRRVLIQKIELGLLDPDWTPEASVGRIAAVDLDSARNRTIARELAERSVILLDPGSALPLGGRGPALSRVAVVGPCADDPRTLMGCYAFPNHVLPQHSELGFGIDVPSVLAAWRTELPGVETTYAQGCPVSGNDGSGIAAAVEAARAADLCIAVVGDRAGLFGRGTSGEGCDAAHLKLPGRQSDLVHALLDTGTPIVLVVVSGRPYALGEFADRTAGLVQAFMPGEEGAAAIAGVLSGRVQPSGKLPVQVPRHPGGQPSTYLQPRLGAERLDVSNLDPTPLFGFGHGRSYTTFTVDALHLDRTTVPTDGEFTVSTRVTNTGDRAGDEVVQLYLHDVVASVTRPVKQLVGFARVPLGPGESRAVSFRVHADRTAFVGRDLLRIVEPGELEVFVGTSADDLPLKGCVRLSGPVRVVGHDRCLVTPVEVGPADA